MINIILILLLSGISSVLYRAGGLNSNYKHWIPKCLRQSWVRDWLCPIFVLISIYLVNPFVLSKWWLLIISYGIMGASLSTYWDWLFDDWDNFWFSGFMCGMAIFPIAFCGVNPFIMLARAVILALIWGGVNAIVNNNKIPHSDFIEEYTRGFSLPITILLFI